MNLYNKLPLEIFNQMELLKLELTLIIAQARWSLMVDVDGLCKCRWMVVRPRKFSYSPSSAIRLAIVSDIYITHIVCSQLLDIKCLSLIYQKLTFIG